MNFERFQEHLWRNRWQSLAIVLSMVILLGLPSFLLAGGFGVSVAVLTVASSFWLSRMIPASRVMRFAGASRLSPHDSRELFMIVHELSKRGGLETAPDLYLIPSYAINAFAVSGRRKHAIAITQGLLHTLNREELEGVLAHEISHIASRDTDVMKLADIMTRASSSMATFGFILSLILFPLALFGGTSFPAMAIFMLLLAPTANHLLQLALSRTREFAADLQAARLTGNPHGLASALEKLDLQSGPWWRRLYRPQNPVDHFGLLRTHPATSERVERLLSVAEHRRAGFDLSFDEWFSQFFRPQPRVVRRPRVSRRVLWIHP